MNTVAEADWNEYWKNQIKPESVSAWQFGVEIPSMLVTSRENESLVLAVKLDHNTYETVAIADGWNGIKKSTQPNFTFQSDI